MVAHNAKVSWGKLDSWLGDGLEFMAKPGLYRKTLKTEQSKTKE